jgi:hypothetical protein
MLMKNISEKDLMVPVSVLLDAESYSSEYVIVPAGEVFDCKEGYCQPFVQKNGGRKPSIVEQQTMRDGNVTVELADPAVVARWKKVPKRDWYIGQPNPYTSNDASAESAPQVYKGRRVKKLKEAEIASED